MNIKGQGNYLTLVQGHSDSKFSNFFSLETARLIEAKYQVEPWDGGIKVSSNGLCHMTMTKIAAMSIYSENLQKSFSLKPKRRQPWNFVYSSTTKFIQMMTLGCP